MAGSSADAVQLDLIIQDPIQVDVAKNTVNCKYLIALDFGSTMHLDLKKQILLLDKTGLNGNPSQAKLERMKLIRLESKSFNKLETLSMSLYDNLEADVNHEDSVFSTRNFFLWVISELLCEDHALNLNLGRLFRKTKYYNKKRDDIPETFEKLGKLFNETIEEVQDEQMKIKDIDEHLEDSRGEDNNEKEFD